MDFQISWCALQESVFQIPDLEIVVFLTLGIRVITPGFKRNTRKLLGDEILSVCDRDTNIWATWQQLSCHSHHCTASRETTQSELATKRVLLHASQW